MLKVNNKLNFASNIYIYIYIAAALLISFNLLGLWFSSGSVHAETVDYSVSVDPVLDVTISTNKVSLDLNPLTHTFDSGSLDVGVSTNNATGYQLFLSTSNNNTSLNRDATLDGDTASMETLATLAGGYTETTFTPNRWGFKITASDTDTSLITANYFPFTLDNNIATNHYPTDGDSTTLNFAAKIDYDQIPGTYKNTLVFTAVATYAAYSIEYYNGYDNTTTIATQSDSYNTSSNIKLNPTYTSGAPTRSTYTLRGWCLGANSSTIPVNTEVTYDMTNKTYSNQATVCNGTEYQTGDNITIDPTAYTTGLKLYAVWTPTTFDQAYQAANKTKNSTTNHYQMQDITSAICNNVTINQYGTLTDSRDNQNYTIGKLEDGRCWMADNLNFDAYANKSIISASNTHVENNTVGTTALDRFKNGGGNTSDQYAATAINTNSTYVTNNNWINSISYSDPLANRSGSCNDSTTGQCASPYQGANYNDSTVISMYNGTTIYNIGPGSYKVGTHYNYCAASLGSYCYGNGSSPGTSASGNATNADICPSNWRLPIGGSSGEFQTLYNTISSNHQSTAAASIDPLSIQAMLSSPISGDYSSGSMHRQGYYGFFWTSTYYSSSHMYGIYVKGTEFSAASNHHRHHGYTIRCIAQN